MRNRLNRSNPEELSAFTRESDSLWKVTLDRRPFQCLTRKDVQVRNTISLKEVNKCNYRI